MKKAALKVISATLVTAMALSVAACGKKGNVPGGGEDTRDQSHSGQKVADDSPWFNASKVEIKPQIDTNKNIDMIYTYVRGADDKYIVAFTDGNYTAPKNVDWNNYNSNEYAIGLVTVIDRNTKQAVNSMDLVKKLSPTDCLRAVNYTDGKIKVVYSLYDPDTEHLTYKEKSLDPANGNVLDTFEFDSAFSIEQVFNVGSYRVDSSMTWDAEAYYYLDIYAPDKSCKSVEVRKQGSNISMISAIVPLGTDRALVIAFCDNEQCLFDLDMKNGTIKEADMKEFEWLSVTNLNTTHFGQDGCLYYLSPLGVSRVDFANKKMEDVFNFSWCGENRNELAFLSIADCSADRILLGGASQQAVDAFRVAVKDPSIVIYDFSKADKNPNAGKTIMELYIPDGYVNQKIADALNMFNNTNSEYFIEVTGRYSFDPYDPGANSQDEADSAEMNNTAKISNQLAMDILNGTGPDILMNVSNMGQLNNPAYLADLTKYIGTLDSEKYFTNIIEGSKTNGALYQLPLCFGVEGIITDKKYAGASGVGFTTQEYEKYLKSTLNGKDIIPSGQTVYFTKLFSAMSDKFIDGKKVDFKGPEFAALAEYVKNNVQEKSRSWNEPETDKPDVAVGAMIFKGDSPLGSSVGSYNTCYGPGGYLRYMAEIKGDVTILGIPSTDGRGPMFSTHVSVAVSAQAKSVDACGEFVKLLLSDEIMTSLGMNDEFVISRTAYRQISEKAVEYYNGIGGDNFFGTGPNVKRITYETKDIDNLEKIILNCSRCDSPDSAINVILMEEMQAYFSGQKDLNSVILIAQDRVQKVINERG